MFNNSRNNKTSNKVSNLKTDVIKSELSRNSPNNVNQSINNLCEKFCNNYIGKDYEDFKKFTISELENIYGDGNMILDLFYVTPSAASISQSRITKLQYIISNIIYAIQTKKYEEQKSQSKVLQDKMESTFKKMKNNKSALQKLNNELIKIRNDINSILATTISIILAISIISAAVIGIENINPNYIVPFVSSIIFFGMAMILFIYSIYRNKIPLISWIIVFITFLITTLLWSASINKWIDISKEQNGKNLKTENVQKSLIEQENVEQEQQ